ncbi:Coatomer subunit epsilon, putative [Talaromyces stipitatus ATCC 10500]|uniref:Coatomer subunit epsilon n=1 Tax=Talaromyces stipitatus (strain ATCC 10500 / CBS 375.48 / QM 6759 / NRRL 1006) TaxID=441959 RepID=B8M264_TALSN|nr:Coatomer subunit epsilon, putative [Talaromyces stipitatus ATCC 10500]EED21528.1 Coatomer subunit epsilon, putative [Talaromyces stipitatus ATCC 10500]
MDPFSAEGELVNIHNAFHQGQYQTVIDFDTTSFSSENALPSRILQLRAKIALKQTKDVLSEIEAETNNDDDVPDLAAVKALALQVAGNTEEALALAQKLAETKSENATVQVLVGTVLQAQGLTEEALALLGRHQGNLEAVALTVQIYLQTNRVDLAVKEVSAAKRWAQDSLLVNIAESWVGLRVGGEKYQSAFYVYEELASNPNTTAPLSIVGQAIAELHLGRLPEAEAALTSALEKYSEDVELIANTIVLNVLTGKDTAELKSRLESLQPSHVLITDLAEKSSFFDTAAAKYVPKVSS